MRSIPLWHIQKRKSALGQSSQTERWLLAIESSGKAGSVALSSDRGQMRQVLLDNRFGSAKTLAPAIRELLVKNAIKPNQLSWIASTVGPGSFTGLRVGVATAKTMAYALGIPAVPVDTLAAVAASCPTNAPDLTIWTIMNAYRGELFVAAWSKGSLSSLPEPRVGSHRIQCTEFERMLPESGSCEPCIVIADSLDKMTMKCIPQVQWIVGSATALGVAQIAWKAVQGGQICSAIELQPNYLRGSSAEEKLGKTKS
jgi:tRNA threonylcarbamoyladenosine biosynthesis protein TsaB